MKRRFYIVLVGLLSVASAVFAGKKERQAEVYLSPEEQCFRYYFFAAKDAMQQEDFVRAMATYLFLAQKNPNDAATQQELGDMWMGFEKDGLAMNCYANAYRLAPETQWRRYISLLSESDAKAGIRELERTIERLPDDREVLDALVGAYAQQSQWKKAIRIQERICYLDGLNKQTCWTLYWLYVSSGQEKKALQLLDDYLKENPEDYSYQDFRAGVWLTIGEEERALQLFHEEEERHPDNPYILLSLANYHISKKDTALSKEYVLKALRSDSWGIAQKIKALQEADKKFAPQGVLMEQMLQEFAVDYPLSEEVYEAQDKYYSEHGDYGKAKEALRQLTDINPNNSHSWERWLNVTQEDTISTYEEYEYVIRNGFKHRGDDGQWYYWMAVLMLLKDETDSVVSYCEEGVQVTAKTHDGARYRLMMLSLLGDIYMGLGALEKAYQAYDEALLMAPESLYILNNYAYTLSMNNGDLRKAERMSRKTIEKEPDNATYLDTYAWILHLQGQDFLAEFYIKKAMENQVAGQEEKTIIEHYNIITHKDKP